MTQRPELCNVVMGLSGGMDSATLLGRLLASGCQVYVCSFAYGSKHSYWELKAAKQVLEYYADEIKRDEERCALNGQEPLSYGAVVGVIQMDLSDAFKKIQSDLLKTGGDIPEGGYAEPSMSRTVVPGRNTIMISVMLGIAQSVGCDHVAVGVHSGDHHIYPDCRVEYCRAMDQVISLASEETVRLFTPFEKMDKEGILREGLYKHPIPTPYHLTRTCYKFQELACGKCGSCNERLEAWGKLGRPDLVKYDSLGKEGKNG